MSYFLQECTDFIEGRLEPCRFVAMMENNVGLRDWLQSLVPTTKMMYVWDCKTSTVVQRPYTIGAMLKEYELIDMGGPKGTPAYHYFIHKEILQLISQAFPDLKLCPDSSLKEDYELCMDVCPQYIGGAEIAQANILGKVLAAVPRTLTKAKRKREAKAKILEAFHVEGKNYPRWNQEPEWPVYNGRPMKFIRTERVNAEISIHYFADVETGFERRIEDAF